jgi:hypothetical protein
MVARMQTICAENWFDTLLIGFCMNKFGDMLSAPVAISPKASAAASGPAQSEVPAADLQAMWLT